MAAIMLVMLILRCSYAEEDVYGYPTILQERSTAKNLVLHLHNNFTLNLERSSVLADKLLLVTSSHGADQFETVDTLALQEVLYQDTHHQSSLILRQKEGVVQVEGIINHELRIKPLPQHERSLQGRILHKIYKVREIQGDYMDIAPRSKKVISKKGKKQLPPANGEKFTAELHLISDSVHQKEFKKNEELIAYLAVMTNAVNLRYVDMRDPRLSVILVGVTRSKDDPFAEHIQGYLSASGTLNGLTKYYQGGKVPGKPDMVYLITGQDIRASQDGILKDIGGRAFVASVCSNIAVGEGEDTPLSYAGTYAMAHELAHMLGTPHDGWSKDPDCAWSQGYLMSYVDGGTKRYQLSKCSQEKIREKFKKLQPECIKVQAEHNYQKDYRKFPGQTVREQKYCKAYLKLENNVKLFVKMVPNEMCKINCCYSVKGKYMCFKLTRPAGMACGNGKTCKRGVCGVHTWEQFK